MKRYISHLVFALLGCMALSACVDNDYMELDKGHNELALSTSNTEVVLNEQAYGDDALELRRPFVGHLLHLALQLAVMIHHQGCWLVACVPGHEALDGWGAASAHAGL